MIPALKVYIFGGDYFECGSSVDKSTISNFYGGDVLQITYALLTIIASAAMAWAVRMHM